MASKKRRITGVRPSEVTVICFLDNTASLVNLSRRLPETGIRECGLSYCGKLCLSMRIETSEASRIIPAVCEHSEAVCIGRYYGELLREHSVCYVSAGGLSSH